MLMISHPKACSKLADFTDEVARGLNCIQTISFRNAVIQGILAAHCHCPTTSVVSPVLPPVGVG